ncbi:MAG: IS110 family transposase [Actinomycetota bacterium]|nr:IS110 family transposase [Actinomycetota bacterium]
MIYVGDDWSEDHHDIEIQDADGRRLARQRLPEGAIGVARFHALVAEHADDPGGVAVGIETDRGLWVAALVAAGYQVYAINPKAAARYRERYGGGSGAKSDPGDARVLADAVRTDRHIHRRVAGDTALGEGIKVLARAHQRLVWSRQRQTSSMRSLLREYYPAALVAFDDLGDRDALAVLGRAPTPQAGRRLSKSAIVTVLRRVGRRRYLDPTATKIQAGLRSEQLDPPTVLADAYGAAIAATVAVVATMTAQLAILETQLADLFAQHPDTEIVRSLPGLGPVVGARVLGEFGDDPHRYADVKARRNYAGTSPITVASGKRKVVKARYAGNHHLADACYWWAFCALNASPGARRYYDRKRTSGAGHDAALRALANRLVGILDGCLRHRTLYDETRAWPQHVSQAA